MGYYEYLSNANEFIEHNRLQLRGDLDLCKEYRTEITKVVNRYTHENFRRNEIDRDLTWIIHDFTLDILRRDCEYALLCTLIVTDMIPLMLRVFDISQIEMKVSTHKMRLLQRFIGTLLSPSQLSTYNRCIDDADPVIVMRWRKMINEIRAEPPVQITVKRFYRQLSMQESHTSTYHVKSDKYMICTCHYFCCKKYVFDGSVKFWGPTSEDLYRAFYGEEEDE